MPLQPSFAQPDLRVPRVTRAMLVLFIGLSILNAVTDRWLGALNLVQWTVLLPTEVLRGEVWRLVAHPWIDVSPFALLFGGFALFFFARPLERSWGERRLIIRMLLLTGVPAALTTLLALALPALRSEQHAFGGASAFTVPLVVAFASLMRGQSVYLFPLPFALSGDSLLYLEGGMLALSILFSGTVYPYVPMVISFLFALAWFRLDAWRGLRRRWLGLQRRGYEARLAQLRRRRGLHVVGDDDERGPRYLN